MMPPLPSQKGTGKKGRDARQSRSRNTTPSLTGTSSSIPPGNAGSTAYLELPIASFRTTDDLTDKYTNVIPNSQELGDLLERLNGLTRQAEARGSVCDKGMRMLAQARKDRLEEIETERRDEENKERLKREVADEEERGRNKANKIRKRKDLSISREERERPFTHGAHGLAPQDGSAVNRERSSPIRDKKPTRRMSRDNDSASSSLSPPAVATPAAAGIDMDDKGEDKDDDVSSIDEHQPPPAPAAPRLQTFGDDPSTFPDPTVYEIRKDTEGLSREEKMKIYSVAYFPERSLDDLIPGSPPDKDFSNAKPSNQVQANTFQTYLEPYFRPLEEQDMAFLRERGDRVTPFITPRRGKRHYKEIWAEEDGALSIDTQHKSEKRPLNQARGNIESLNDDNAESDDVSTGPITSRLLALLRPEHRAPPSEERSTTNGLTNGEPNINSEANMDLDAILGVSSDAPAPLPPATYMPESNTESWKKATHPNLDYSQMDERLKLELRHIGFLPLDGEPDFDAHNDDDVAVRLRFLQAKLKEVAIMNGARKARVMDIAKEQMAAQEYNTILEDLDGQVQTAYLKRTRTLGKSKKTKRPGGAGGGSHFVGGANTGMARPGIGDMTKTVMERRKKWIETIGGVLDPEASKIRRQVDPDSSIFKPEDMAEYIKREQQAWDEDAEEE